jgi:hypothetical protein
MARFCQDTQRQDNRERKGRAKGLSSISASAERKEELFLTIISLLQSWAALLHA